jgi:hypothetical protein
LQEVLCGLIMVLDFTLIGGLTAGAGRQGVRHLLIGALGCNIAWGIIDGALYVMGNLTGRRQRLRFLSNLRGAPNEGAVFSAISGRLDPLLEPATSTEERISICHALLPVMSRLQLPQSALPKMTSMGWVPFSGLMSRR